MIAIPLVWLPVGPALRSILGDDYFFGYGLAAALLLMLLTTTLASRWAVRHGGEWVAPAERLRRLVAEASATPPWQTAVLMMATVALTLTGLFLVIEPLDQFGGILEPRPDSWGVIAALSLFVGVLSARRPATRPVVAEQTAPADQYWPEVRRMLPRMYLAYGFGTVTGFFVASQVPQTWRNVAFLVAYLATSLILIRRWSNGRTPLRLRAFDPALRQEMLAGVLLWGVPMGILFAAMAVLDPIGPPTVILIYVAAMLAVGAIGGLAFGALMHLIRKLGDSRRPG